MSQGPDLIPLVQQDQLAVSQDAQLPLPGPAVTLWTLAAGEPVSWRAFNIYNTNGLQVSY